MSRPMRQGSQSRRATARMRNAARPERRLAGGALNDIVDGV